MAIDDDDNALPQDEDENTGVDDQQPNSPYFVPGPVHRQQPAVAAAKPAKAKEKVIVGTGRPRGKIGHLPNSTFENREIELLWPEILEWMKVNGKTPRDVAIRVIRIEPPPREVFVRTFDGTAVQGSPTMLAADAFIDFVARYYHMGHSEPGPAMFHFMFMWKATGQLFATGELRLPAQQDLRDQYQIQAGMPQQRAYQPPQQLPPWGTGSPPEQPQFPPNYWQQQPQQQQQQQQPQQPQENEAIWRLRQENQLLREKLELEARASRGRPQGFGQPPVAASLTAEETLARTIRAVLGELGVVRPPQDPRQPPQRPQPQQPPAGFGYAPPWQQQPSDVAETTKTGVGSLKSLVGAAEELREVGLAIDKVFGRHRGDVQPPPVEEVEEPEPNDPGFDVADVGPDVKWRDGRPVKIARDKDGNIDWLGVGLANPMITETLVEKFGDLMSRIRPAGVGPPVGVGQEQQEQPQQLPPREEPEAEPSNGQTSGFDLS